MNPDQALQIKRLHETAARLHIDYIMSPDMKKKTFLRDLWQDAEQMLERYLTGITTPYVGGFEEVKK